MTNVLYIDPASSRSAPPFGAGVQSDIELLHSISVELIGEKDRAELYGKIVDAAISITQS